MADAHSTDTGGGSMTIQLDRYRQFDRLLFERPAHHVLRVTLNRPERRNALDGELHDQLTKIWACIDDDEETRATVITGAGSAFCAGGDLSMIEEHAKLEPVELFQQVFADGTGLAYGIMDARKPIVSAINGPAFGAGLALALLSDIPVAAKTAVLIDGHTRIGIAAGDHAALIWPLLCGLAKAKYYLMTNRSITGEEAERMNLVALAVEDHMLQDTALGIAVDLAATAPSALAFTKHCLNHWMRQARPIFELSLAMEALGMSGPEAREAQEALKRRRQKT